MCDICEQFELPIHVNGTIKGYIVVTKHTSREAIMDSLSAIYEVKELVYVPGKLIQVIVK